MSAIIWKTIAGAALPALIEQAAKLFTKADSTAQGTSDSRPAEDTPQQKVEALSKRVEQLEISQVAQAKLIQQTLEELQKVTILAAALQARANMAVVMSALAVIGCVLALIF
ncbi:hypothetical protein [Rhodanobacter sp. UC4436_H3]